MRQGGVRVMPSFAEALDQLDNEIQQLIESLHPVRRRIAEFRQRLEDGSPTSEIVKELGAGSRRTASHRLEETQRAIRLVRALAFRSMIEEEGLSISEAARITGVSRQMASRLLAAGREGQA